MDQSQVIPLTGFDPEGEPVILVQADGAFCLSFEFMPPSWGENEPERFDDFDQQLSKAVELPVEWEDRERFRIESPAKDTVERIRKFLESYERP